MKEQEDLCGTAEEIAPTLAEQQGGDTAVEEVGETEVESEGSSPPRAYHRHQVVLEEEGEDEGEEGENSDGEKMEDAFSKQERERLEKHKKVVQDMLDRHLETVENFNSQILESFNAAPFEEEAAAAAETVPDGEEAGTKEEEQAGKKRTRKSKKDILETKRQKQAEADEQREEVAAKMEAGTASEQTIIQPDSLTGTLMPHQLQGYKWLKTLYMVGTSGILADEMGLGKTIQIIAWLAWLSSLEIYGPFIIIAPKATLRNWEREVEKWCPSLSVLVYHGTPAERREIRKTRMKMPKRRTDDQDVDVGEDFPIVISSYEICQRDSVELSKYQWKVMIVDEGHRIKNKDCDLAAKLDKISAQQRVLLTGTPIQNTLQELWSLLHFVNPRLFADLATFEKWFNFGEADHHTGLQVEQILSQQENDQVVSKLHGLLRPFLLRRLKRDVLKGDFAIPPKREIVIWAGLSPLQRQYYALVEQGELRQHLEEVGIENARNIRQTNKVMNQRKVSQHPFLFGEPRSATNASMYVGDENPEVLIAASGKLAVLHRMLVKLRKAGHRVLIFSQFVSMINILHDYFVNQKWGVCRIDGQTEMDIRQEDIDNFNDPSQDIFGFLLSTRAGGLGINLCAADTVILFDSDWNPHIDSQAMDRAHRIGQTNPVAVYRLVAHTGIEWDMMQAQLNKKKLDQLTVGSGEFNRPGQKFQGQLDVQSLKRTLMETGIVKLTGLEEQESISDAELDVVLDRVALFGGASLATMGEFYQILPSSMEVEARVEGFD